MKSWLAVALGASFGAWLRWGLSLSLNQIGWIPLGTLTANALGGWLMGVALGLLHVMPSVAPEWRLFITTGFLGGLTTFSTFSAEAVQLLQKQHYGAVLLYVLTHVLLSLTLTVFGYWCVMRWQQGF